MRYLTDFNKKITDRDFRVKRSSHVKEQLATVKRLQNAEKNRELEDRKERDLMMDSNKSRRDMDAEQVSMAKDRLKQDSLRKTWG